MHRLFCYEYEAEGTRVLPFTNWLFAAEQIKALKAHDKQHRAPDGVGWTVPYRLEPPPESLVTRAMSCDSFRERLAPLAPQFEAVTVEDENGHDFSGDDELSYLGFGPSGRAGVVAECRDGKVDAIWCVLPGSSEAQNPVLAALLHALDRDRDLILVNWHVGVVIPLAELGPIEAYLAALLKRDQAWKAANPAASAAAPPRDSRRLPPRSAAGAGPEALSARLLRSLRRRWQRRRASRWP